MGTTVQVRGAKELSNMYLDLQTMGPNAGQLFGYLQQDGLQGVELQSGQKVTATMGDSGDVHLFRFHAIEGDQITIQFAAQKKSGLEPVLRLIGPEDEFVIPALVKGKTALKKLWKTSGLPLRKLFNTSGQSYRQGGFKQKLETMSDDEALAALAADGKLIKRPLLDAGNTVLVGFKEADYEAALR